MSLYILGFVAALILAALVIAWIAYCMFIRERPKSEFFHHNITDLQRRNYILDETVDEVPSKKEMAVGVFVLPSRHKQKIEEYDKRPDYPESPAHKISHNSTEKLVDMLEDSLDVHYRDGIYEVDSRRPGCDTDV
ncbi:hypothetical protein PYW08_004950 [Mythimna loreyi]|uniref:Uncharacterized protein n=1 Tax=Mythimna loreyi TaxID=667449 RepID=A0ACC2QFL6_9NEOP|nr:hypothetical protein PYW08_004950 [Mythimna loreyi]